MDSPRTLAFKAKDNPFRAEKVVALPFDWSVGAPEGWAFYESKLRAQGGRGLICAPCGFGKTTLLDWLETEFDARGKRVVRVSLRADARVLPDPFPGGEVLLFDGLEQLSWGARLGLRARLRAFETVIATSHRRGFLPLWWELRTSPALLLRLCEGLGFPLAPDAARALWDRHGGNLRLCLGELYNRCARGEFSGLD